MKLDLIRREVVKVRLSRSNFASSDMLPLEKRSRSDSIISDARFIMH